MDEQKNTDTENMGVVSPEISLGGGVKVLTTDDSDDDVEIESFNEDIFDAGEMTPQERIKLLREKLKEANVQKKQYLDGWQRLKADFANYKKREDEGKGDFIKFAREGVITDILPILESFHMAFANKEAWNKVDSSWRVGVEYIHTQLLQMLASHGLTEVNPVGEMFNPNEHTSIGTIPTDDEALNHKIAEVAHLGYRLSGKLIRSPRVKIYSKE